MRDSYRDTLWMRVLDALRGPRLTLVLLAVMAVVVLPKLWLLLEQQKQEQQPLREASQAAQIVPTFGLSPSPDALPAESLPELVVWPEARQVALVLEPGGGPASFGARLESSAGGVLWQGEDFRANAAGLLLLSIPAKLLPAGDYQLFLEGATASGPSESAGGYSFRVVRPGGLTEELPRERKTAIE